MDAQQIVDELKSIGVHLSAREGRVKLRGPEKYVKDPAILERVRERKPEIIAYLSADSEPPLQAPTRRCLACKSWLFWVSTHRAVTCATCHPPANRQLVKEWLWVCEVSGYVQ